MACEWTRTIVRVLALGMVAVGVGAVHSLEAPVHLRLDDDSKPKVPENIKINLDPAGQTPNPVGPERLDGVPSTDPSAPPTIQIDPSAIRPPEDVAPVDPETLGLSITIQQARALHKAGLYSFLDTRLRSQYDESHIQHAEHLSVKEFNEPAGLEVLKFLDPKEHTILYCDGGSCDASENLAILLKQYGFTKLHIMTEGFGAWENAGYPVDRGGGQP